MKHRRHPRPSRAFACRPRAEALERRVLLDGGSLLADINRTTDFLYPSNFAVVGDVAYFAGRPFVNAETELFKTDGTIEGTVMVREIVPGLPGGSPARFTPVGGTVFFAATDPTAGRELWKTNGTVAGTVRVKDIAAGASSSDPLNLTAVGDTLFFTATDGSGVELWKSDGTEAGTVRVKHISFGSAAPGPSHLVALGNVLLFAAGQTRKLWRSDGTEAGTVIVGDTSAVPYGTNPRHLTRMNDAVYFVSDPGTFSGRGDLYRTDGTTAGTYRVKKIDFGPNNDDRTSLSSFVVSGDLVYFFALYTDAGKYELWRSDGSEGGTFRVKAGAFDLWSRATPLGNGSVVFPLTTPETGMELWTSDGTPDGAQLVGEISPGPASGLQFPGMLRVGSQVYFSPNTVYGDAELWATDGFSIRQIADVSEANGLLSPEAALGDKLLFNGFRFIGYGDLYSYDAANGVVRMGVAPGQLGIGNASGMTDYTSIQYQSKVFLRAGPYIYFEANDGSTGSELWRTNPGAGEGEPPVVQVADVAPGGYASDPAHLTLADDGTVYFTARTLETGRALYRVLPGGTGAEMIFDRHPGPESTILQNLVTVGDALFFSSSPVAPYTPVLWRYDPATGSTTAVTVGLTSQTLADPTPLVRAGNRWFFTAKASFSIGYELYSIDSPSGGATLVRDIVPGSSDSSPRYLVARGDTLFFVAAAPITRNDELWKSDGTAAGTVKVSDFAGTAQPDGVNGIFTHGNFEYIARGAAGLWRSDGTTAGTVKISSVEPYRQFAAVGDNVFFLGSELGTTGVFRYDPATGATTRFTAPPGATGFDPMSIYAAGGDVFAVGQAGNRTRLEMWRIDGDAPAAASLIRVLGPRVINDGLLGFYGGVSRAFATDDTHLYFPAHTPETGIEPYRLELAGRPAEGYVVGREVFHAGTAPAAGTGSGKQALLPGYAPGFVNVTSRARGIDGLWVDFTRASANLSGADFEFALTTGSPASGTWTTMPWAASVTLRPGEGAGGADRAVLRLPDKAARNTWLRVTVKATATTGLARPDVFYFGNLAGETGDAAAGAPLVVDARDLSATRKVLGTTTPAAIARYDFDGDGRVNVSDLRIVRANYRRGLGIVATVPITPAAAALPPNTRRPPARRSAWEQQTTDAAVLA